MCTEGVQRVLGGAAVERIKVCSGATSIRTEVATPICVYSTSTVNEGNQISLIMAAYSILMKTNTITEAKGGMVRIG